MRLQVCCGVDMPQGILKYNLSKETKEHLVAIHAMDWAMCLWDIDQDMRSWLKHGHTFQNADEAIERLREMLYEYMTFHGISFDMID